MKYIASLLVLPWILCSCGDSPSRQARHDNPQAGKRVTKQADTLVQELAAAEPTVDGIAIMIVLDTSSSMAGTVKNAAGVPEPKLAIAKRCAKTMIGQIHKFAVENADRRIIVGITGFADAPYKVVEPQQAAGGTILLNSAIDKMRTGRGTAIGDAVIFAKKRLDQTGYSRLNILTITDGENTTGKDPATVAQALNALPSKPALYLIGFDVAAATFRTVQNAGGLVFSANNEAELLSTTDFVLGTKILAEKPEG